MVYYRKYRPQTIDDLDNADVREKLFSLLAKDTPHAFLFTGSKGLGKTSAARIVAKAVNCEQDEIEPCNQCEQCLSITNGTNLDVLEIDAASNRGIDEIRELKEKLRLSPIAAKKKVYIIDEVHMLTTEAFNALLKTLEEPPEHALFILCTTESHKIPATILSRCVHIHFHLATKEELIRSFTRIATGEAIDIDPAALALLADLSEGGFRDGAKIFEEVVSRAKGKMITTSLIEEKYHSISNTQSVADLFVTLKTRDAKAGLEIVQRLVEQGIEIKYFVQEIMKALHRALLLNFGISEQGAESRKENFDTSEISILFELFTKVSLAMKTSVLPQLPLELAIIAYCHTPQGKSPGPSLVKGESEEEGVTVSSLRKQVGAIKKNEALYGAPKKEVPQKETIATTSVALEHVPQGEITKEWLDALWKSMITEMKTHNHTIAGVLRGCKIKSYDTKILVIETTYRFHKERLDEAKTREALHVVAKMLTGKEVEVQVELKG